MLNELSFFSPIAGSSRLLYNENAARLQQELTVPAHRAALARGDWAQSQNKNNNDARAMRIVRDVCMAPDALRNGALCGELPAITMAELHCARALLSLLDYCAGNNLNIGRAMMLVHAQDAAKRRNEIPRSI